jgi:hypothetical protein
VHGASITAALAAGGRAVVHHDERYHWRPTRPGLPEARWRFRRNVILLRALRASSTPHCIGRAAFRRSTRFIGTIAVGKTRTRHAVIELAYRRSDDRQRHDHEHEVDDPADDPADRTFGFARLKAMPSIWSRELQCRTPPVSAPPGFQIHLKFAFCSNGGDFSVLRGSPMWNGWKKAAIGLSALLTFVLLELMAVIGGVAVFPGLVMDVDLPLFAASEE